MKLLCKPVGSRAYSLPSYKRKWRKEKEFEKKTEEETGNWIKKFFFFHQDGGEFDDEVR